MTAQPRPDTYLSGRSLLVVRAGWVTVALLAIVVFVVSFPRYFEVLRTPCPTAICDNQQLEAASIQTLRELGLSLDAWAVFMITETIVVSAVWCVVGAVIFWRKSDEPAALFVALFLVAFGVLLGGTTNVIERHSAWWVPTKLVELAGAASLSLFFYLFPDGRFVPRWTRWLALVLIVIWSGITFLPGTPFDIGLWLPALIVGFFSVWFGSGLAAQIYRYRRVAGPIQRQQTKWVVFAIAAIIVVFIGLIVPPVVEPSLRQPGSVYDLIVDPVITFFWVLLPLAIGIAILRYRLYDIDIIIRRTLVYSILTLTLGLVYVGCILVSRAVVAPLTGGSELAIVVSTLVIAALFSPLRRRIQNLIDKRFYRRKYDAAKVLAAFGATARDETDLDALTAELLRVVDETMQPEFVGLWLPETPARSTPTDTR